MRLGIVGMLPGDFRTFTKEQMDAIRALQFTGFGFHFSSDDVFDITTADCERFNRFMAGEELDLVQFAVTYSECLFDPDPAVRESITTRINRGAEIARQLNAHAYLIRPGSLNPDGPWTSHRDNHLPESMERLIETLTPIAQKAAAEDVTIIVETHAVSIMDSPETCKSVVDAVGCDSLRIVMDYVNHFQTLQQVYNSTDRLNHIFDVMGPIAPVAHLKDIKVTNGLVLHLDEEVPGEGELDFASALRRFDALYPDGYGLIEHLPMSKIPLANENVRRIAAEHEIDIR
ncbi:MAG: sugar phosphate isomerase/epimerase [Candidatus Poribacteria bacterium]|nr:sugar phosphate isomerase/epimerase [Candidatus Poribacteria bacterium]